jgi:hypothetical protein
LGLRWIDIGFEADMIQIRQQVKRIKGQLVFGPVRTSAGKRDMPLLDLARNALDGQAIQQASNRVIMGSAWPDTDLVFTRRISASRPAMPR